MLTVPLPRLVSETASRVTSPGAVMSTLDCYAMRLSKDVETRPKRGAYSMICLVVSGQGRSQIGDKTFEWSQHDVFTVPSWSWASHRAISGDADLFIVSDKVVSESGDVLRGEFEWRGGLPTPPVTPRLALPPMQ